MLNTNDEIIQPTFHPNHYCTHNMDYKDLTAVLIKITGAALFFWYLTWLPSLLPLTRDEHISLQLLFVEAFPAIVGLVFAAIVFLYPATITNKLISGEKLNFDATFAREIQITAIRLIGIYHVLISISDLVHHVSKALLTPHMFQDMGLANPPSGWTPDLIGWVIASFVELFIALWLVFGAKGILKLIGQVRGHRD